MKEDIEQAADAHVSQLNNSEWDGYGGRLFSYTQMLKTFEAGAQWQASQPTAVKGDDECYSYWPQCDVDGCEGVSCSAGGCWNDTGYWIVCPEHSKQWREGKPQPQMKQRAIKRELSRDKETGILPKAAPKGDDVTVSLRAALTKAVELIKTWHNMQAEWSGMRKEIVQHTWDIYWRSAPEMKVVREAVEAGKPAADWKQKLADHFRRGSFDGFNTDEQSIANWIEENVLNQTI